MKSEEKLQSSYVSFSTSLEERYSAYPDFVEPVRDAISQVRKFILLLEIQNEIVSNAYERHVSVYCRYEFESHLQSFLLT